MTSDSPRAMTANPGDDWQDRHRRLAETIDVLTRCYGRSILRVVGVVAALISLDALVQHAPLILHLLSML